MLLEFDNTSKKVASHNNDSPPFKDHLLSQLPIYGFITDPDSEGPDYADGAFTPRAARKASIPPESP